MPELMLPYTDLEMSEQVNRFPNQYGMLGAEGLFPSEGMAQRVVEISMRDDLIVVLASDAPGAAGQMIERDTEGSVFVGIPHFPMKDAIKPEDLQGLREVLGSQRVTKTFDRELAKILKRIRYSHDATREFIRIGALKGLVKDGKGKTLLDLFTKFGVTKKVIYFNLSSSTQSIIDKCQEVFDYYAENLKGEAMSSIEVKVSGEFFSALIQHPKVEKFWLQTQNAQALATISNRTNIAGNAWGRRFEFGQLVFQEYKGFMPLRQPDGQILSARIIEAGKGHAYPVGTQNVFRTFDGPVHHIDKVNQVPEGEVFMTSKVLDHGDGVELRSQSNMIALAKRPDLLVELDMGAGS